MHEASMRVTKEVEGHFLDDILGWYERVGTDTSVLEMVDAIVHEAIFDDRVTPHEIVGCLTSSRARARLDTRIREMTSEIFREAEHRPKMAGKPPGRALNDEDRDMLRRNVETFIPMLVLSRTVSQFLRELIAHECDGEDGVSLSAIREFVSENLHGAFVSALLIAMKERTMRKYSDELNDLHDPSALRMYVSRLAASVIADECGEEEGLRR